MKKRNGLIITIFILAIVSVINAQNSDFIAWEATAHNTSGETIKNQEINVMAALHFGTPTAISSYVENHKPTTDANGVFKIEIGNGVPVAGSYKDLSWGSQNSFVEIIINGVSSGTKEITKPRNYSQFVNPAVRTNRTKTSSNSKATQINPDDLPIFQINVGDNTLKAGKGVSFTGKKPIFTISVDEISITAGEGLEIAGTYPNYTIELKKHFVGENYLGGIVFYVEENGQHGLIVGRYFPSSTWTTFKWEAHQVAKKIAGQTYDSYAYKITPKDFKDLDNDNSSVGAGWFNTMKMIMNDDRYLNVVDVGEPDGSISFLSRFEFPEWYVPSYKELRLIYEQRHILSSQLTLSDDKHIFWSSNEGGYIWKGKSDGPTGQNYGGNIAGYSGVAVKLGGKDDEVRGVKCLNFYTGKSVTIAKTYDNPFILIRKF